MNECKICYNKMNYKKKCKKKCKKKKMYIIITSTWSPAARESAVTNFPRDRE